MKAADTGRKPFTDHALPPAAASLVLQRPRRIHTGVALPGRSHVRVRRPAFMLCLVHISGIRTDRPAMATVWHFGQDRTLTLARSPADVPMSPSNRAPCGDWR